MLSVEVAVRVGFWTEDFNGHNEKLRKYDKR